MGHCTCQKCRCYNLTAYNKVCPPCEAGYHFPQTDAQVAEVMKEAPSAGE